MLSYGYLTNYMHPYVVIGIMILASAGILIGGLFLFRNVFDRIDEKWHDRWQYYKVIGVKSLRKAVLPPGRAGTTLHLL